MIFAAPAKINLNLHVIGQRADGYHLLESLVAFAPAADEISIELASVDSLTFSGPFGAQLKADPATNLVLKARDALRQSLPDIRLAHVAIQLTKNLPLSSGIGGGSADAAATLHALNAVYGLGLSLDALCNIGRTLGADVPMCLHSRPLIAKGIGEIIEPVALPDFNLLLVNPNVSVSTPAIFKALPNKQNAGLPMTAPDMMAEMASFSDLIAYLENTRNDLQPPAITLQPVIGATISALETHGASFARMSGSGATCFGVFENATAQNNAAAIIQSTYPDWWIG